MIPRLTLALVAVALFALLAVMPVSAESNLTQEQIAAMVADRPYITVMDRIDPNYIPPADTIDSNGMFVMVHTPGDTIELLGENTASDMTYLFITGPDLPANGAQINNPDPAHSPLENGNPATFQQTAVRSDHTWSWKWDTTSHVIQDGTYKIYVVPRPTDYDHLDPTIEYGFTVVAFKNSAGSGTVTPSTTTPLATIHVTTIPSVAAKPATTPSGTEETVLPGVVTIVATGNQSYHPGDEIQFSGTNTGSYKTYLFITGPNLNPKGSDIRSTNPGKNAVADGVESTFKVMDVNGDHTWSWTWGTSNSALDAGTYTIYAAARPHDKDNLEKTPYGTVSIVIKKPLVSATASPTSSVATPTPTTSPGFDALITLIGLGAIAFIVMRR
ncbi:hypothetical protein [Methanoregula sp.]|uniref:PGF-CTERM sorting domain-containing protein n=1 Tax=Methanoregula sp. TaxID=2052170 RepID=UPI00236AF7CA|nr:hypothetical protein [Methanoregula sp.]MDD1685822.1 hypothetical protein [Methanoregula sp.]